MVPGPRRTGTTARRDRSRAPPPQARSLAPRRWQEWEPASASEWTTRRCRTSPRTARTRVGEGRIGAPYGVATPTETPAMGVVGRVVAGYPRAFATLGAALTACYITHRLTFAGIRVQQSLRISRQDAGGRVMTLATRNVFALVALIDAGRSAVAPSVHDLWLLQVAMDTRPRPGMRQRRHGRETALAGSVQHSIGHRCEARRCLLPPVRRGHDTAACVAGSLGSHRG